MSKQSIFMNIQVILSFLSLFCGNADPVTANQGKANKNDSLTKPAAAIAYIRNGSEIRLINPDGTNDRRIWTHPDAKEPLGLFDLAWRPDGKELAFSSAHATLFSVYHADIYSIRPDGSSF